MKGAIAFAVIACLSHSALQAQQSVDSVRVIGSVVDSAGHPLVRAIVCTTEKPTTEFHCTTMNADGEFVLRGLHAGRYTVTIGCSRIRGFGKTLASDSIDVGDSIVRRTWQVTTTGCDQRQMRTVSGTFRGHYTPGFESSEFRPCAADAWFLPQDSLGLDDSNHVAWVTWPNRTDLQMNAIKWPRVPNDKSGNPRYYVKFKGRIVGPGSFGHMGVSPFEFLVDSVFFVRAPSKKDCRP